jgi:hypothetical protein
MGKNPRGICIIVNNFVKIVKTIEGIKIDEAAPKTIPYESIKFKKVFEQLHFDVRLAFNLNTNQIRELLISLKKRREFSKK